MLDDSDKYKMMMNKIMVNFNAGRLPDNSFFNSFLPRVWEKMKQPKFFLSDKEKEKIEEIFDKY